MDEMLIQVLHLLLKVHSSKQTLQLLIDLHKPLFRLQLVGYVGEGANARGNFLNVQTGAVDSIENHPFDLLARLRFRVTVITDNRLMSDTCMSKEMFRLAEAFGYGWSDLERFTVNAMKSAFIHFDERLAIIDEVIKPRFAVLMG
jgi:hypothetical protein